MPFITITYPPKYPLTESEKKWLVARQKNVEESGWNSCESGELRCLVAFHHKILQPNWKGVAEFEARVAEKLAEGPEDCSECFWGLKGWSADNAEGRLKSARLAVEAEMEKEGK